MDAGQKPGGKRKLVLLAVLIAVGGGIVLYGYIERAQEQRIRQAREETARSIIAAMNRKREAAKLSPQQQEKLVAEAKGYLDAWGGKGDLLDRAGADLERVIKSNFRNAPAHIEMARYYVMRGYISGRRFQPGTLDKALWEIQYALSTDPKSADAYVYLGHLFYLKGAPQEAVKDLQKAEAIGTDNPWLYLNWANALMDLSDYEAAEARLRMARARIDAMPAAPPNVRIALHSELSAALDHRGKLDDANNEYLTLIMLEPGSAWNHGNYAYFLLFRRGLPDAAIAEANQALKLMDYGIGRLTLAAAWYAKWAQVKKRDPNEAAKCLAAARALSSDFSWIMPQAGMSVAEGPVIQDMVKGLMSLGVSINTRNDDGDTGLTLAAYTGRLEAVEILAKYGANLEAADNDGATALQSAAVGGHADVVRALAARGARVGTHDSRGFTPLHYAVSHGNGNMVRTLLSLKADPNAVSLTGDTPLMDAARYDAPDLARLLIEAGADPNARNKNKHQTAADIAAAQGHADLARYLRQQGERHRQPGART